MDSRQRPGTLSPDSWHFAPSASSMVGEQGESAVPMASPMPQDGCRVWACLPAEPPNGTEGRKNRMSRIFLVDRNPICMTPFFPEQDTTRADHEVSGDFRRPVTTLSKQGILGNKKLFGEAWVSKGS